MLKVSFPQDANKVKKQITALEWQISHDTSNKDREIHLEALKTLKQVSQALNK